MIKQLVSLFLFLLLFLFLNSCGTTNPSLSLLFKSSFDENLTLFLPNRNDSTIWNQELNSSELNNYSWPIELQGERGHFQMIINDDNISKYIENKIELTIGIDGNKTKALHQIIKKKEYEWSQDPYVVYTKDKEQKKLYIRYSLKYPKNLSELLGKDSWLTFSQFKTTSDYRLSYYIYSDENSKLYWYAHGDNVVVDDVPYKEYWYQENRKIAVPQGEWFDVEIFWDRSTSDDGRVWLAIDGQVVIDYQGVTKLKDPIHEIMLFTNYAEVPLDQWVDNIEIWDDFPCGVAKSCHK